MKDYNQDFMMGNRQYSAQYPYTGMYPGYSTQMPYGGTTWFPPQPSGATIPGVPATPGMPGMPGGVPGTTTPSPSDVPGMLPLEQSFIENILRLNKGKVGTFYFTYENNNQWNAKVYTGVIEAAGRDHIILSDPQTGVRYLLLMVNFDYATFEEEINYEYPIGSPRPRPIPAR